MKEWRWDSSICKAYPKWTFILLFPSRLQNLLPPSSFVTFTPYSTLRHLVTFFSTSQRNEETRIRCLQTTKSFSPRTSTHQWRHDDRSSSSVNPKTRDQIVRIETQDEVWRNKNERIRKFRKRLELVEEVGNDLFQIQKIWPSETGDGREILTRINLGLESQALVTKTHS